jgi:hypothetical protein
MINTNNNNVHEEEDAGVAEMPRSLEDLLKTSYHSEAGYGSLLRAFQFVEGSKDQSPEGMKEMANTAIMVLQWCKETKNVG